MYFIKKNAYVKYLSFATLGSYVSCLGAKVFKFLWMVVFGGLTAKDEQRQTLVSAHPQIPLWSDNLSRSGIALFVKYFGNMFWWYSKPCRQHEHRHTTVIRVCNKIFYPIVHHHKFFSPPHKPMGSNLTNAGALIYFITPPFSYTKMSLRISGIGFFFFLIKHLF